MRFSQFCDMAENTEQEQQLLQFFKNDEQVEKIFSKMTCIPVVGKLCKSLLAMGDYESISAFRQSEHYDPIKDWNFAVDFDKKSLSLTPNDEQKKKAINILIIIIAVIMVLKMYRKICNRKKY